MMTPVFVDDGLDGFLKLTACDDYVNRDHRVNILLVGRDHAVAYGEFNLPLLIQRLQLLEADTKRETHAS